MHHQQNGGCGSDGCGCGHNNHGDQKAIQKAEACACGREGGCACGREGGCACGREGGCACGREESCSGNCQCEKEKVMAGSGCCGGSCCGSD